MGKIYSIQTFSVYDGPGLRTVVYFKGCFMRCKYCFNPDAWEFDGEDKTAKDVIDFCDRYRGYYGVDGGVTLSGGEPLAQSEFCLQVLAGLKRKNIHTALYTSGCVFRPECLDLSDLVILDVKSSRESEFYSLTGYPADGTIKTLNYLKKQKRRFWVRQVIVPGLNDSVSEVENLADFARGAERVELMGYSPSGAHKYRALGLPYSLEAVPPMDNVRLTYLQAVLNVRLNAKV